MQIEDILGLMIPITYLALLALEAMLEGRQFPALRLWRLKGTFFVVVLLGINATAPSWLPAEWLAAHRLVDGTRLGIAGGAVVGYLALSFAMYWFHRAEHRFDFAFRWLHQLHHSPSRVDMAGAAYTSPLEVAASATIATAVLTFGLGLHPTAIAITGYVGAFYSMFQHLNVKTPCWLGYLIERPESHCLHHERGIHARNYSDLPLWDIVFGTFHNPPSFSGAVGFEPVAAQRVGAMMLGRTVEGQSS